MGFFFRKSTRLGPFRLNFSKSGIGASLGVKGARITATPRGLTYITVGTHGFYYRETLSRQNTGRVPPAETLASASKDTIASAGSSDLIDSSSEKLVQQLNARAKMFNPAWILYVAAIIPLFGLAFVPDIPAPPKLPEAAEDVSASRNENSVDEYAALTARYGEPDSILFAQVNPLAPISAGTAVYSAAHVKVVFVPNGCVEAYNQAVKVLADKSRKANFTKRQLKDAQKCQSSSTSGWRTVSYIDSSQNGSVSAAVAESLLNAIRTRRIEPPIVELVEIPASRKHSISQERNAEPATMRPEMRSSEVSRKAAERTKQEIKRAETSVLFFIAALLACTLSLLILGAIVHRHNTRKRLSRLLYELDAAEQHKFSVVLDTFGLLAQCHRIWRVEAESPTFDLKRNAGASSLVRRTIVSVTNLSPPRVETNIEVPCISMGPRQLYFLPDAILYRDENGYGAIQYSDFRLSQSLTRFIETNRPPSDARIVDHTWRYVNKDGGPDRRFNNNRQLPVLQLGVLVFTSSKGLNIQLHTSNAHHSVDVAARWGTRLQTGREAHRPRGQHPPLLPLADAP